MANKYEWKLNLKRANDTTQLKSVPVYDHPLKIPTVTECIPRRVLSSQSSTGRTTPVSTYFTMMDLNAALEGIDPLTKFAIEEMDPLTQIANETAAKEIQYKHQAESQQRSKTKLSNVESWNVRKSSILAKFTTSEKLTIVSSFLSDGDKVVMKSQSSTVDKVQHRLEQLDYFEEGSQHRLNVSQVEYVGRIEQLNRELVSAWNSEQRVKALKIVIQCAKLLADTDVMRFYPSKFVLVTDILDIFGQLVYDRLRTKSDYYKPGTKIPATLPEDFTPDMVPESSKETCRNWFYKIASIRELVPRIYVEMAILKSYSFLTSDEFSAALLRLTRMIRGIGNPLVATYARCYLCRVGMTLNILDGDNRYLIENFYDFLDNYNHLFSSGIKEEILIQQIDYTSYLTLYTPALDFILQAVASNGTDSLLSHLLKRCENYNNSALLINSIMAAFKPMYIAQRALQMLDLISKCSDDYFPSYLLLRTLGLCVSVCPPPSEQQRQVLSRIWKQIGNLSNPDNYINCIEAWIEYAAKHCSNKEVNQILEDIINHVYSKRAYESLYPQLKQIIEKIVSQLQDFELLLSMDNFLPFIDLFQQENVKVDVCKMVVSSCAGSQCTSDPVVINALTYICSTLHDSVNALTVEDETRQIGELLCTVVKKIDYGRDFEQQLSFYVEARGAFSNIDIVLAELVQRVNSLAVQRRDEVKGNHSKKTGAFVRACAAYCFITIPSIRSIKTRLNLYLLSGQVALFNHCLGQADACFKGALNIMLELSSSGDKPKSNEIFLNSYIKKFMSLLLIIPDCPDRGVLSLLRVLLNMMQSYEWDVQNGTLCVLYMDILDLLTAMSQEYYPYHIDKVDSNDMLYGSDHKFLNEIERICSVVLNQILNELKQLGQNRRQAVLILDLILNIIRNADLNDTKMLNLLSNLYNLLQKHEAKDKSYISRCVNHLIAQNKGNNQVVNQVCAKLKSLIV